MQSILYCAFILRTVHLVLTLCLLIIIPLGGSFLNWYLMPVCVFTWSEVRLLPTCWIIYYTKTLPNTQTHTCTKITRGTTKLALTGISQHMKKLGMGYRRHFSIVPCSFRGIFGVENKTAHQSTNIFHGFTTFFPKVFFSLRLELVSK